MTRSSISRAQAAGHGVHAADAAARAEPRLEALLDVAAQDVLGQEAEQDEHDQDDREQDEHDEDAAAPSHQALPDARSLRAGRLPSLRVIERPPLECPSKMLTFIDSYNFWA